MLAYALLAVGLAAALLIARAWRQERWRRRQREDLRHIVEHCWWGRR